MSTVVSDRTDFDLHNVEEEDHWISVSDLMAGLMMVFLFISIALMKSAFDERDVFVGFVDDYVKTHNDIFVALRNEFQDDLEDWDAAINQKTLTFEFSSRGALFAQGEKSLKPEFKEILDDFFPRYLPILKKFKKSINEVRIEGHTSSEWYSDTNEDRAYFNNMDLSQGRTREVLEYVYQLPELRNERSWVKKNIAAVGLSSSHPVPVDGPEDREKSRRVSFRVITNSESLIQEMLEFSKKLESEL